MTEYRVVCPDGATRHRGTFPTHAAAAEYAEHGHACTAAHRHSIEPTSRPFAPVVDNAPPAGPPSPPLARAFGIGAPAPVIVEQPPASLIAERLTRITLERAERQAARGW